MTIRFELRTTKRTKGAEMVPLHISVSDGRSFRQRQVTGIMINPEYWDVKAGDLKKRIPAKSRTFRRNRVFYWA